MNEGNLDVRTAVIESRLLDLDREVSRQRGRLHALESDRATIRLLGDQMKELHESIGTIARRAAVEAIDLAMENRDELGRKRWNLRIQWISVGVAFGGLAVAVLTLLFSR